MTSVIEYRQLPKKLQVDFIKYCNTVSSCNELAAINMQYMPKLLEERFSKNNSMFVVLYEDNIIGCSGSYVSDFSPYVSILGCRTWIDAKWRNKQIVRNYLFPAQKVKALCGSARVLAVTFNEYNHNLIKFIERKVVKRTPKTLHHLFFNNETFLEFQVLIKNTPQYVAYEKLGEWDFDWKTISVQDCQ